MSDSLRPDCMRIDFTVPQGTSLTGCGTVTRPGSVGLTELMMGPAHPDLQSLTAINLDADGRRRGSVGHRSSKPAWQPLWLPEGSTPSPLRQSTRAAGQKTR